MSEPLRVPGAHASVPEAGESPVALADNLTVGTWLGVSALGFFFLSFLFAYFYLRALNSNHAFHPRHVDPSQGYGSAVLACVVVGALVFDLARRRLATGREAAWRGGAALALALFLAAIAVQAVQYTKLGFGPTSGGYASVFLGWTGVFLLVLVGGIYWVETLLAQSLRGEALPDPGDVAVPVALLRPAANSCAVLIYMLAGVAVAAYIVLYVV